MDTFAPRTTRTRWRRFSEQLSAIILAIVLALIVWILAINQQNPLIQGEFEERIPVTVRGLAEGLQPLQDLSNERVRVVLQAPLSSWENLDVADFDAFIDLSGRGPGVSEAEVTVNVVDPAVKILSVQRPQLRVQLDEVVETSVPVRVDVLDSTAFGYDWQQPVVEPISVTVIGPKTQIDQVVAGRTEVSLRNAKSQVESDEPVVAQNTQGQPIPRVTVVPPSVNVVVPVEPWPGRKEVAVRVNLEGQPAAGYRLSTVRVNPSTVVLLGGTEVLANVPGFVETAPVSLDGATSEIQARVQLRVPEDVRVLDGNTVDVTASITPIQGGTTVRQQPVIQGLEEGFEASVTLDTVEVILSGPLPLLESLGPDDIFVILDLTGLLPGNHIVTPRVVVPTGIVADGVLPESIDVVISAPTPEVTPDGTTTPSEPAQTPTPVATETVTVTATPTLTVTATVPVTATLPITGTPTPAAAETSEPSE